MPNWHARGWTSLCIGLASGLVAGCVPVPSQSPPLAAPDALSQRWMIGVERIHNDPLLLAPFTNRFLATLAGMPKVQVIFLGVGQNEHLFSAYAGDKLRVDASLRAGNNCMEITYTINQAGQQQATYGLVVPALPAGPEPDPACVDRAATSFYQALAAQGL
jgi:hypothetical protein